MRLRLGGVIQSKHNLCHKRQRCYGLTKANIDRFQIFISEDVFENSGLFSETTLHELLHLWFFLLNGALEGPESTEDDQHQVMDKVVPIILREANKMLKRMQYEKAKKQKTTKISKRNS